MGRGAGPSNRPLAVAAGLGVVILGAQVATLVQVPVGSELAVAVGGTGIALAAVAAVVVPLWAARRSRGRMRWAWALLAAAALARLGTTAAAAPLLDELEDLALSGALEAAWPVSGLAMLAGLLCLPTRTGITSGPLRTLLDGLVVVASLAIVGWATVLGPALATGEIADPVVSLVPYALIDLAVASVAIIAAGHARVGHRVPAALLMVGLGLFALADVAAVALLALDAAVPAELSVGWGAGLLALAIAPLAPRAREVPSLEESPRTGLAGAMLPYLALLGAVVAVVLADAPVVDEPVLIVAGLTAIAAFGARQALVVADNLALRQRLEHRVAERTTELDTARRHTASILDTAGDGIYGMDAHGRVHFCNPAAATMLGYAPDELIGCVGHDVFHATTADGAPLPTEKCRLLRPLADGTTVQGADEAFTRRDGSVFPIRCTARPIEREGAITGVVVVFRDITEEQRLERMKDEFVSVVSHELRTPLTSIRGSLGLVASGGLGRLDERGQRMVDIAVSNTDRLVRLLNDILDLQRMESGRSALSLADCRMADLVDEATGVMQAMADDAGVALRVDHVDGELRADPDRLTQVLTNLLSNAIKFSPEGATVRVAAWAREGLIHASVADEGRGIPADRLEQVFGRFQQVDASDARAKGGTGLGLAICRSIVERHGGEIWAESQPGEGTTFRFTLPAAVAADPEAPAAGRPTVLVCDDDASVVEVFAHQLEAGGYRALRTRSGEEALARARAEQPDAIVLDLLMPDMDGWQALAALRADPATAAIPVVVCSVLPDSEAASPADVAGWLTKPLGPGQLQAMLEGVVGHGGQPSVVLVTDDAALGDALARELRQQGLHVQHALAGEPAARLVATARCDLVVLQLGLAGAAELGLVDTLRQQGRASEVPLVVCTAAPLTEAARQRLQDAGVDVWHQPDEPAELGDRLRALLDRLNGRATATGPAS